MEALGNIKPVTIKVPQAASQPVLPVRSNAPSLPVIGGGDIGFDAQSAEAVRMENLRQAARNAPQPLGSQSFTMFKDATGQVVTRFRDANSGKVVYIPEPNLLRLASAANGGGKSLLNISA